MSEPRPSGLGDPRPQSRGSPERQPPGGARRAPGELTQLLPQVQELLGQVAQAVRALNRLVAALEETLARPPVHLQVERLEVQTLAFHLGDIDVEELQGELNIGITHSLRLEPPGRGSAEPQGPPGAAPPMHQGDRGGHAAGGNAPGGQAVGGQRPSGPMPGGQGWSGRCLRNSVVSRRLAQMDPGSTAAPTTYSSESGLAAGPTPHADPDPNPNPNPSPRSISDPGPTSKPNPNLNTDLDLAPVPDSDPDPDPIPGPGRTPEGEPLRRVQVWPPPKSEGSATDDEATP